MGNSLTEASSAPLGNGGAGTVDGSSRTCRIGAVEVEDSFTPTPGSTLPSPAQMRAFCAGAATGNSRSAEEKAQSPIRFHTSVWDAFGSRCGKGVARTPAPADPPAAASTPPTVASPPASASAEASAALYVTSKPRGFSPDLWYAQAASLEMHQKHCQLSHRALKPRSKPAEAARE